MKPKQEWHFSRGRETLKRNTDLGGCLWNGSVKHNTPDFPGAESQLSLSVECLVAFPPLGVPHVMAAVEKKCCFFVITVTDLFNF